MIRIAIDEFLSEIARFPWRLFLDSMSTVIALTIMFIYDILYNNYQECFSIETSNEWRQLMSNLVIVGFSYNIGINFLFLYYFSKEIYFYEY